MQMLSVKIQSKCIKILSIAIKQEKELIHFSLFFLLFYIRTVSCLYHLRIFTLGFILYSEQKNVRIPLLLTEAFPEISEIESGCIICGI